MAPRDRKVRQRLIHSLRVRSESLETLLLSLHKSRDDLLQECPAAMQECAYCRGSHTVGSYTRCDQGTPSNTTDHSRCWRFQLQPCHRLKEFESSYIRSSASQSDPLHVGKRRNFEIPDINTRSITLDSIYEKIKSVHSISLCEIRMRRLAMKVLTIIRSWLVRKRFQKLADMTVAITQLQCRDVFKAVFQSCVCFRELDLELNHMDHSVQAIGCTGITRSRSHLIKSSVQRFLPKRNMYSKSGARWCSYKPTYVAIQDWPTLNIRPWHVKPCILLKYL